ncbi:hypothetical protein BT092_09700 [Corynebacterium diphtheriae]|nr:hypothetical protein B1A57_10845 [Corynebacterium diphtheriae]PSA75144.1 hypothetical protein BT092_09700 [Corynebacterium diphtheriae]
MFWRLVPGAWCLAPWHEQFLYPKPAFPQDAPPGDVVKVQKLLTAATNPAPRPPPSPHRVPPHPVVSNFCTLSPHFRRTPPRETSLRRKNCSPHPPTPRRVSPSVQKSCFNGRYEKCTLNHRHVHCVVCVVFGATVIAGLQPAL